MRKLVQRGQGIWLWSHSQWSCSCTNLQSLCAIHPLTHKVLITCSRSSWVWIKHDFKVGRLVRGKSSLPPQQRYAEANSSPHIRLSRNSLKRQRLFLCFASLIFWLYFSSSFSLQMGTKALLRWLCWEYSGCWEEEDREERHTEGRRWDKAESKVVLAVLPTSLHSVLCKNIPTVVRFLKSHWAKMCKYN